MLILSRKENESIIITLPSGEEIKLKVTKIKKDCVRIGIEAAKDISIKRQEICKT